MGLSFPIENRGRSGLIHRQNVRAAFRKLSAGWPVAPNMTPDFAHVSRNLEILNARIAEAATRAGRDPAEITLVAVTKTHPAEAVLAAVEAGVTDAGENRIQEAVPKIEAVASSLETGALRWHLIGHLQSNKAKVAVQNFDLIHSVDSERLARQISRHAGDAGKIMPVLLQVNVSGEETKGGFVPDAMAEITTRLLEECPHLQIQGFMTMAPLDEPESARPFFRGLRELRDRLAAQIQHERFRPTELSMGMSNDFLVAIEEGSTLVRIGTAIFGQRDYPE